MFFHPCRDVRQAAWDPCSYHRIIRLKREIELCVIGVAMIGEAMCLYDGPSDVVYVEKRRGSKNRTLWNSSDQLMWYQQFKQQNVVLMLFNICLNKSGMKTSYFSRLNVSISTQTYILIFIILLKMSYKNFCIYIYIQVKELSECWLLNTFDLLID